jgi:hypothetical protein
MKDRAALRERWRSQMMRERGREGGNVEGQTERQESGRWRERVESE